METNQPPVPWRNSLVLLEEPWTETEWVIPEVIPAKSVVLLAGREGSMKTWVAMEWAHAISEGLPWQGRVSQCGSVLYLDGEMPPDMFRNRLHAIGGSKNLNIWSWHDASFPTSLSDPLLQMASQQHTLIVVDTLRRFIGQRDENSASEMAIITKQLRELTRHGASILILHHASKNAEKPGYRGSTEIGAGVDVLLHLLRNDREESLSINVDKTRVGSASMLAFHVEKTNARPVFKDCLTSKSSRNPLTSTTQLQNLANVISTLQEDLGRRPNQSEIVKAAQSLGSRNTILDWLSQGEDKQWQCEVDGKSKIYTLVSNISTCPNPLGEEQTGQDTYLSDVSTCPDSLGIGQIGQIGQDRDLSNVSIYPNTRGRGQIGQDKIPHGVSTYAISGDGAGLDNSNQSRSFPNSIVSSHP